MHGTESRMRSKFRYLRTTFFDADERRTRVSLRYDAGKSTLGAGTSIRVAIERRWASGDASALQIPMSLKKSGGRSGLDARFVASVIQSKCFADVPADSNKMVSAATFQLPGDVVVRIDGRGALVVGACGKWVKRIFSGDSVQVVVEG